MSSPPSSPPPKGIALWWAGARPRTLGASISPVLVGAVLPRRFFLVPFLGCLIVAVALQVGVNFANDYFDGVRGVDSHRRVGPLRLTASGLVPPKRVLTAATVCFIVGAAAGLFLAIAVDLRLLFVGLAALLAATLYSGGPRPYAGLGLGELFVLIFFGLVPVIGTAYVINVWAHTVHVPSLATLTIGLGARTAIKVPAAAGMGLAIGFFAVAILLANNIRDIATDTAAGKRTLAVRIGDEACRLLYRVCLMLPFLLLAITVATRTLPIGSLVALGAIVVALRPLRWIGSARGPALIPVLVNTGSTEIAFALLFCVGVLAVR